MLLLHRIAMTYEHQSKTDSLLFFLLLVCFIILVLAVIIIQAPRLFG